MNTETRNALRTVARAAINDYKAARAANPEMHRDIISRRVILSHLKKLEPLGITVSQLNWQIGVLTGVLTER
ncbi:hypothetical protein [Shimwellia blattae]|uniref:Uncharacterized protein n=1 Tax=Shimwellia blattae (strain ATCC 29907 / DSM 4481 / JCM 1650 / NBRC 105725 / CDC 9005-74) TaxID=630626 RepID=I2B9U9_SHIBC|nr:hypothetical protein [Shimwellia blattae]AFJ47303.1 hypothetical protein EBL_c22120 [Shimwellia blattae DSM 4481 = NBRC 105725]GAB80501.1 hypothetical protein EB105725_05_02290 [Shimwellia blattae DSM 4481 = NBRC 105725]VDY64797.1 Uncharacterised protein [Shimwellia blattae]VEC22896.1 Uncharacterised protein [Shimwellia blattae]